MCHSTSVIMMIQDKVLYGIQLKEELLKKGLVFRFYMV